MAESRSVRAVLSAVDKGFTSTIRSAQSAVQSLGERIKSGFAFGVITRAGEKAFDALATGARDLIGELNSSANAWATFEGNLSMLGKSADEIAAAKKELQKFAQDTVYNSSDMATTFSQLAAVGVENTEKLVKGFGGLAAAAENPQQAMKTLSTQATQMAAKPKVAWEDFKLMLEQSPAGIAAVARAMGKTTAELVADVQDGNVATKDFLATIAEVGTNEEFTKLATKAKTMGQALDGAKEMIANKLMPAFHVLSEAGISAIDSIAAKLDGIDAQGLADKLSGALDKVLQYGAPCGTRSPASALRCPARSGRWGARCWTLQRASPGSQTRQTRWMRFGLFVKRWPGQSKPSPGLCKRMQRQSRSSPRRLWVRSGPSRRLASCGRSIRLRCSRPTQIPRWMVLQNLRGKINPSSRIF